ncbi:MAG: hypothetical protein HON90_18075 [Halobacteriovoraceae bacterium]|jgi:hypothetical protein|nr:hypothetical protein [Halobacteriovoraceae bacterium]
MKLVFVIALFVISFESMSRPQYAVRRKINDCTACHFNPSGGGARNLFGKTVGSRNHKMGKLSKQDLFSIDYRAVSINTAKAKNDNPNGSGIMTSNATAALPVAQEDDGSEVHAVASYDFGGFGSAARETYAKFTTTSNGGIVPKSVLVGRFNIPFGLLTDEHRTYTKKQTNTSINVFEMGAMISGNPHYAFHYDLAMVEGYQKNAGYPSAGNDYGVVLNLRYNFNNSPVFVGASGLYNKGQVNSTTGEIRDEDPWAAALYAAVSLDHITNKKLKGSFITEVVLAHHFNRPEFNSGLSYFVNKTDSATYYAEIQDKHSLGLMARLDLDITEKWSLFYKVDSFAPDEEHLKDQFLLSTIGAKYWYNSNVDIDVRYEKTEIKREGIEETKVSASKDKFLIIGRIWI